MIGIANNVMPTIMHLEINVSSVALIKEENKEEIGNVPNANFLILQAVLNVNSVKKSVLSNRIMKGLRHNILINKAAITKKIILRMEIGIVLIANSTTMRLEANAISARRINQMMFNYLSNKTSLKTTKKEIGSALSVISITSQVEILVNSAIKRKMKVIQIKIE